MDSETLSALADQHSWMPTQAMLGIADSGVGTQDALNTAESMRQAVSPQDDGYHSASDDPVLHKAPSLGLALTQYISQSIGPWPVAQPDLSKLQKNLQKGGFGKDLPVSGSWDPGWQAAFEQYHQDQVNRQYHSGGDGGFSFGGVLHTLSSLDLDNAGDAIVGFIKAIPSGARDLMAGLTMTGLELGGQVTVPFQMLTGTGLHDAEDQVTQGSHEAGAFVNNLVSPQQELTANQFAEEWGLPQVDKGGVARRSTANPGKLIGRDISAVGTILLFSSLAGKGSAFANTIGIERGAVGNAAAQEALTTASAYKGPGVVARSIGGSLNAEGELQGGLAGSRVFNNIPVLGRSGPWLEKVADADAAYYRTRGFMSAALYKHPAARIAGAALSDISIEGAKIRGTAALSQIGGNDTPLSTSVQGEHIIDSVDAAVKSRLGFTFMGAHIAPSINDLQFVFHPAHGAPSAAVGKDVDAGISAAHGALQDVGFTGALERATGKNLKELEDEMGGRSNFTQFYSNKMADIASTFEAEHRMQKDLVEAGGVTGKMDAARVIDQQRALETEIRNDPEQLTEAIKGLRASFGNEETAARIRQEIANSRIRGFESLGGRNYMDASEVIRNEIAPWLNEKVPAAPGRGYGPPSPTSAVLGVDDAKNLGLAHADTLTRHAAFTQIRDLEAELTDLQERAKAHPSGMQEADEGVLGPMGETLPDQPAGRGTLTAPVSTEPVTPEEIFRWRAKMGDFLHNEFHIDARAMPQDEAEMVDRARQMAGRLAGEVFLGPDAPQSLIEAKAKIEDMGYKLVNGTDIGHVHIGPNELVQMDGAITHTRKTAEFLGISPDLVANSDIAAHRYSGTLMKIQDAIDKGRIKLPPYVDAHTLMSLANREGFIDSSSRLKSAIARLTGAAGEEAVAAKVSEIKARSADLTDAEITQLAQKQAEDEIAGVLMPADIPRKKFVAAFTDPEKYRAALPMSAQRQRIGAELKAGTNIVDSNGNPVEIVGRATAQEAVQSLEHVGALDKDSAEALYQAFVAGAATPGWYQLGASKLDYLFRSSMGFAGRGVWGRTIAGGAAGAALGAASDPNKVLQGDLSNVAVGGTAGAVLAGTGLLGLYHGGGDNLGWALANMPNRYRQIVNNTRFQLSPYFSLRRYVKTNAKMALEDVPATINPLRAMQSAGTVDEDRSVLARIYPSLSNAVSDDADRYLQQQDVFGLYNHRNFEAYAAGHLARQGLSDSEIKDKLIRIFEYGKDGTIGRSQLERSTNFLFFPFSFDKTLYRNFGSYLLDNPGQRMILTRGLAAYDQFNKEHMDGQNPLATSWWTKHAPLMEEASHLNAFAHGISPGELGGINRPLLNMFLPQAWSSSPDNLSTLKRFVPAIKDFARITDEIQQQGSITVTAGENMYKDLRGIPSTYADPHPAAETTWSQLEDAFSMQRNWYEQWAPVLDANAKTTDPDKKAKYPMEPKWGKWAGEPITKASIQSMIQARYPAYDPIKAVDYAVVNNRNLTDYLLENKGTQLGDYAQSFVDATKKLASGMARDKFDARTQAQYTSALRQAATYLASNDGRFYKLYDRSFRKTLGPLEDI